MIAIRQILRLSKNLCDLRSQICHLYAVPFVSCREKHHSENDFALKYTIEVAVLFQNKLFFFSQKRNTLLVCLRKRSLLPSFTKHSFLELVVLNIMAMLILTNKPEKSSSTLSFHRRQSYLTLISDNIFMNKKGGFLLYNEVYFTRPQLDRPILVLFILALGKGSVLCF